MLILHAPSPFSVGGEMLPNSELNQFRKTYFEIIWLAVVPWLAISSQIILDFSFVYEA